MVHNVVTINVLGHLAILDSHRAPLTLDEQADAWHFGS